MTRVPYFIEEVYNKKKTPLEPRVRNTGRVRRSGKEEQARKQNRSAKLQILSCSTLTKRPHDTIKADISRYHSTDKTPFYDQLISSDHIELLYGLSK